MKFELISFPLCPYVQRSVITLKHKQVPFDLKDIDLENPPEWFNRISPLGKVPVLVVDGKTSIFESAVINEFIDEVTEPRLMPTEPLRKAFERSWIEFGSELLSSLFQMSFEDDAQALETAKADFFDSVGKLEEILPAQGPYFRGAQFSLVDTSFAPLFLRLYLFGPLVGDSRFRKLSKVQRWAEALRAHPAVRESLIPGFAEKFTGYLRERGSKLLLR